QRPGPFARRLPGRCERGRLSHRRHPVDSGIPANRHVPPPVPFAQGSLPVRDLIPRATPVSPITPQLLAAARGDAPADLILVGGRVVNVFTGEIDRADIAIHADRVAGIGAYRRAARAD